MTIRYREGLWGVATRRQVLWMAAGNREQKVRETGGTEMADDGGGPPIKYE